MPRSFDSLFSRYFSAMRLASLAASAFVSLALCTVPTGEVNAATTTSSAKKHVKATKSSKAAKTSSRKVIVLKNGKRRVVAEAAAPVRASFTPARPSLGQAMGLHQTEDALSLRSGVALVMDQGTNEVLYQKNATAVLPIASITKLMTALVVMDAHLPMDEVLTITEEDRDTEKHSGSRLRFGAQLPRQEMLLLALMSSENRAASVLGRSYPGGLPAFVQAMNRKAHELGMNDSHFVDSNGLSSSNVSSAMDLVRLINAAYRNPTIREFSTETEHEVNVLGRPLHYVSTNRLVRGGNWDIGLQKTGFINEAGQCLVMQARVNGRNVVMVFLDAVGKLSRFADANRVREWLEHVPAAQQPHPFPAQPSLTQGRNTPTAMLVSHPARGA